eukprot:scaffold72494_cov63-Phaeocystis_antarctica.AAC.1
MEDAWVVLLVLARHVGGLLRLGAASGRRGQAAHHRRRTASDGGLVSRVVEVTRTDRVVGSQATLPDGMGAGCHRAALQISLSRFKRAQPKSTLTCTAL